MDRKLKTLVCAPVGNEFGVDPGIGLQFREDILVALAGEDKGPLCIRKPGCLVGECSQFIRQGQLADTGADIVDSTQQVFQMGNGRHPGTAPGVGPAPSRNG